MSAVSSTPSHWTDFAKRWDLIGAPLRPSSLDLAIVADVVAELVLENPHRGLRVLILGVTPEYARFPWPLKTTLIACERSETMIRHVWPGSTLENASVIHGTWLDLDASLGKFDLVLGDGILTQLSFQEEYNELSRRISALLAPGGRLMLRLFTSSEAPQTPESVLKDSAVSNVNEFKLRLGMALSESRSSYDIPVAEIWKVWDRERKQQPELNQRWSAAEVSTIESYRESTAKYSFPPLHHIQTTLTRHFNFVKLHVPNYVFGKSCPTMILQV